MKTFLAKINVFNEDKLHVVTADDRSETEDMLKELWLNDGSLKIIRIDEVTTKEVVITKHN